MDNHDSSNQQLIDEPFRNVFAEEEAARIRCLLENLPLAVGECDVQGAITWANPAHERMIGYSRDELVEMHVADLLADGMQKESVAEYLQHLALNQPPPTPYVCQDVTKSGRIIDVQVDWVYKRDTEGNVLGFISVISDVTERRRAEEAAQAARDELERRVAERTADLAKANEELNILRLFADASNQCFQITDLDGTIRYVNPAMCRLLGEERCEDLIGTNCFRHGRSNEYILENVLSELLRERRWDKEGLARRKDGTLVPVWISSVVMCDASGEPAYFATVFSDITAQKQAEEALAKQHRTLKYLLRSSDHERQLIAYEIHDGLAQHLAGAMMQFQVFDHVKDSDPARAARVYEAGMTMLRQGHFEARRLIAGVRPPVLDESGVSEAIAHLVHEQRRDKGPRIEYSSKVDFVRLVPALENAMFRICQEALTNACRHSKSPRVRIRLAQRGGRVRIAIRDWGVGFDVKAAQKNRFGLEGIRQRARLLGGRCSIRSIPGQGTQIVVELPVVERDDD